MQDVGFVVEQPAKPVTAEVAHDGAALVLGIVLDRGTDVAGGGAFANGGDAAQQRFVRDLDETLSLPCQPSRIRVTSMLTTSPSRSGLPSGSPWQTTWFNDVQIDFR